jgi:hypothetical protein
MRASFLSITLDILRKITRSSGCELPFRSARRCHRRRKDCTGGSCPCSHSLAARPTKTLDLHRAECSVLRRVNIGELLRSKQLAQPSERCFETYNPRRIAERCRAWQPLRVTGSKPGAKRGRRIKTAGKRIGINIIGDVGMTSHIAGILRRHRISSRIIASTRVVRS